MPNMGDIIHTIFLLLYVSTAYSVPLGGDITELNADQGKCQESCSHSTLWKYQPGTVYSYDYTVRAATAMKGTTDQESVFSFKSRAKIGVSTKCNFILKMEAVEILESEDSIDAVDFEERLGEYSLEFGFDQGRIRNVCPHSDEPIWILNIKKGILSAFQQSFNNPDVSETVIETDVTGECETEYSAEGGAWSNKIRKVKKMGSCSGNQVLYQYALNLPDVNIQHLPLLKSNHECEISLDEGKLQFVTCKEDHLFKPFSNGDNGAVTQISQSLVLHGEDKAELPLSGFTEKTDLRFRHNHQRADGNADEEHVKRLLDSYLLATDSQIPTLFNNLVYSLRNLRHSQLVKAYHQIKDERTKNFFLDALPILKTNSGVSLMRDVLKSGVLPDKIADGWYSSLAFYKNPTRSMISTLSTLLNDPRKSSILGISSLVSTYCSGRPNCKEEAEVHDVIRILESMLGESCDAGTMEHEDRLILVLKGLRNIGILLEGEESLRKCYQTKSNSVWVRIAALDTVRKMACSFVHGDLGLFNTFKDIQEDSEIRIGAYLAIFNCPTDNSVQSIRNLLVDEPINQVGSFIWTHITNIQETGSKDDWRMHLKSLVGSELLQNKWNSDPRKFSRNIEFSYFANELRIGALFDGNIIFSEDSYLPRSGMLNITTNIFGENINVVEFGTRLHGFEDIVEDMFGPEGYFREDTIHKFVKSLRSKRDSQSSIDSLRNEYGPDARILEPRGNVYMRLFGRDLYYNSFKGLSSLMDKTVMKPLDFLGLKFGDNKVDFAKSAMFLDGSIIVPTIVGMPLNLTVNGTSTVKLTTETHLDVKNIFKTGQATLEAKIYPAVTLEVSALMSVDSFITKTGLKSVTKLHSSAYADIYAEVKGGRLAKVHVNLPTDKTEILDTSAEFFTYDMSEFKPMKTVHKKEGLDICTPKLVSDTLGLEFCAKGSFYHGSNRFDPSWYFAGPSKAEIYLKKTDKFDKIVFDYSWNTDDSKPSKGIMQDIQISLDTPGSRQLRKSYLHLKFDDLKTFFLLDINIPLKETQLELRYDWGTRRKILKGAMTMDGLKVINLISQLELYPKKYDAFFKVIFKDTTFLDWQGTIHSVRDKYSMDATLLGYFHSPVIIKGDFTRVNDYINLDATVESDHISTRMISKSMLIENGVKFEAVLNYRFFNYDPGKLYLLGKLQDQQTGMLNRKTVILSIQPSAYPHLNTDFNWLVQSSENYLENDGYISIGSRKWMFHQQFNAQATMEEQELVFRLELASPSDNMNYSLLFQHELSWNQSNNVINVKLTDDYKFGLYSRHRETLAPYSYVAEAGLMFKDQDIKLGFNVSEPTLAAKQYIGTIFLEWSGSQTAKTEFSVGRGNSNYIDYTITSTTTITGFDPIKLAGTLVLNPTVSNADFNWKYQNGSYGAQLEYQSGKESKLNARIHLNGEEYVGYVLLKNDDVSKEIVVNVKADRDIYLTGSISPTYSDINVEAYWDRNRDDSKSLAFRSSLADRSIEARMRFLNESGIFHGNYSPTSLFGMIEWGNHKGEIEGRMDFSSHNIDLLASVKSSLQPLEDLRAHLKLSSDAGINGRHLESKVELKLNKYHHMIEISWQETNKIELSLNTISTFKPFDKISLYLKHQLTAASLVNEFNIQYQDFFVNSVLHHFSQHNNPIDAEGNLKLETSFPFFRILTLSYSFLVDRLRNVAFEASFNYNDDKEGKIIGKGTASWTAIDMNIDINHNFRRFNHIIGKLNHTMTVKSIESIFLLESEGKKLNGNFGMHHLDDGYHSYGNISLEDIRPLDIWFKYTLSSGQIIFQTETKFENIQLIAANFKLDYSKNMIKKFTSAAKLMTKKGTLKFSNTVLDQSFYMDIASGSILTTKLNFASKYDLSGASQGSFHIIEINTPSEIFNGIKFIIKEKNLDKNKKIKVDLGYKNLFLNLRRSYEDKEGRILANTTMETNLLKKHLKVAVQKISELETSQVMIDGVFGEKDIKLNMESVLVRNLVDFKVNITGSEGKLHARTSLTSITNQNQMEILFIDNKGLEFKVTVNANMQPSKYSFLVQINTPFTDTISINGSVNTLDYLHLQFSICQPDFVYANISGLSIKKDRDIKMKTSFDVENIVQIPRIDIHAEMSFDEDINMVLAQKHWKKMNSLLHVDISESTIVDLQASWQNNEKSSISTFNAKCYQDVYRLNFELDIKGSEKYADLSLGKNGNYYKATVNISDSMSTFSCIGNISTPIEGYKKLTLKLLGDKENKHFQIKGERDDHSFSVSMRIDTESNPLNVALRLSSNIHPWKEIYVECEVDLSKDIKRIKIKGISNDKLNDLQIKFLGNQYQGEAEMKIDLPFLAIDNKHIQGSYLLTNSNVTMTFTVNGLLYNAHIMLVQDSYTFEIVTPISGFSKIEGQLNKFRSFTQFGLNLTCFIENKPNILNVLVDFDNQIDIGISLKSNFSFMRHIEVTFKNSKNTIGMSLRYDKYTFEFKAKKNEDEFEFLIQSELNSTRLKFEIASTNIPIFSQSCSLVFEWYDLYFSLEAKIQDEALSLNFILPKLGESMLSLSWKHQNYSIILRNSQRSIIELALSWKRLDFWTGEFELVCHTLLDYVKQFDLLVKYNLGKVPKKDLRLNLLYNDFYVKSFYDINAFIDKFDCKINWQSSVNGWRDVIFNAKYTLDEEPDANISIIRNGREELIALKVIIDGYLPIIEIKTPFQGYENLRLTGTLKEDKDFLIEFMINTTKLFAVNLHLIPSDNKDMSYLQVNDMDSQKFYSRPDKNENSALHYIHASISLKDRAFKLYIMSPIENMTIAGQFGTTVLQSSVIVGHGRQKRELHFGIKDESDVSLISFNSLASNWTGIQFSAGYQRDSKAGRFLIGNYGENNFTYGIQFDFTQFPVSSSASGFIIFPLIGIDYEGKFEYSDVDGTFFNGFNGNFSFLENKLTVLSGTVWRSPGKTEVLFNTPLVGWNAVSLSLESDWKNNIKLQLKRDHGLSELFIEKTEPQLGLIIRIITPYKGYEEIEATFIHQENDMSSMVINQNGQLITRIDADVNYDSTLYKANLDFTWTLQNGAFIIGKLDFSKSFLDLAIKSSFRKIERIELKANHSSVGEVEHFEVHTRFNDHFINYKSRNIWSIKKISSFSVLENNISFFPFNKSVSNMTVEYSKSFDSPFTLKFISIHDGITVFDVSSSIIVSFRDAGIELVYSGKFPIHEGKVDAKLMLKSNFDIKLEIIGSLDNKDFRLKLVQMQGNLEAVFNSNIDEFENLNCTAHWMIAQGSSRMYGIAGTLNYLGEDYLGLKIKFDTNPFHEISGQLYISDILRESFVITITTKNSSTYVASVIYEGFNSVEGHVEINIENYILHLYIVNKTKGRTWNLKTHADIKSQNPIYVIFEMQLVTPFTKHFNTRIEFDFSLPKLKAETMFTYGNLKASTEVDVLWLPEKAVISLISSCPSLDLDKFEIICEKEGLDFIKSVVSLNGKQIQIEISNAISDNLFDIDLQILLPVPHYENTRFVAKGERISKNDLLSSNGHFYFVFSEKKFMCQYQLSNENFELFITTPLISAQSLMFKWNFKHLSFYGLEAKWNDNFFNLEHRLDLQEMELEIDYKTSFQYLKRLEGAFKFVNNEIVLRGRLDGLDQELNFSVLGNNTKHNACISFSLNGSNLEVLGSADFTYKIGNSSMSLNLDIAEQLNISFTSNILRTTRGLELVTMYSSSLAPIHNFILNFYLMNDSFEKNMKLFLNLNSKKVAIEMGSTVGHIYFELKSPIPRFNNLKMDIDHKHGNLKVNVIFPLLRFEAAFTRTLTIYNFDIRGILPKDIFSFHGKIDLTGKALQTFLRWNKDRISMKANYSGNTISIALKTPYKNLDDVVINGSLNKNRKGFEFSTMGNIFDKNYTIQAYFSNLSTDMYGSLRVQDNLAKKAIDLKFNLTTDMYNPNLRIQTNFSNMNPLQFEFGYRMDANSFNGVFNLTTPFKNVVPDVYSQVIFNISTAKNVKFQFDLFAPENFLSASFSLGILNSVYIDFMFDIESVFLSDKIAVELVLANPYTNDSGGPALKLYANTPFTEQIKINLDLSQTGPHKEVEANLQLGKIKSNLILTSFVLNDRFEFKTHFSCPLLKTSLLISAITDTYHMVDFSSSCKGQNVKIQIERRITENSSKISANMNLPFSGYEDIQVAGDIHCMTQDCASGGFNGKLGLDINGNEISLDFATDAGQKVIVHVNSPKESLEPILLDIDYEYMKHFNIIGTWKNHEVQLLHIISETLVGFTIDYKIPFEMTSIILFNCELNEENFIAEGKVVSFNETYHLKTSYSSVQLVHPTTHKVRSLQLKAVYSQQICGAMINYSSTNSSELFETTIDYNNLNQIAIKIQSTSKDFESNGQLQVQIFSPSNKFVNMEISLSYDINPECLFGMMNVTKDRKSFFVTLTSDSSNTSVKVNSTFSSLLTAQIQMKYEEECFKASVNAQNHNMFVSLCSENSTIHVDAKASFMNQTFKCHGNLSIENMALDLTLILNTMKFVIGGRYTSGQIALTINMPSNNLDNVIFKGSWKEINGGFEVCAAGNVDSTPYEFQSRFYSDNNSTSGFWKVVDAYNNEYFRFELDVKKSDGMNIVIMLEMPESKRIKIEAGFTSTADTIGGVFNLSTPFKNIITDIDISFKCLILDSRDISVDARASTTEKITILNARIRQSDEHGWNVKLFVDIPMISEEFGIDLLFEPFKVDKFSYGLIFGFGELEYGGEISYMRNDTSLDTSIKIKAGEFDRIYLLGGKLKKYTDRSEIDFYFNSAKWSCHYTYLGEIGITVEIDMDNILQQTIGIVNDLDVRKLDFSLNISNFTNLIMKLNVEDKGKAELSLDVTENQVSAMLDLNFPTYRLTKLTKFSLKFGQSVSFELTLLDGRESFSILVDESSITNNHHERRKRAIISSSTTGLFHMESGSSFKKGVLVATSTSGIHKFSYEITERDGVDVRINIETPLLENGYATLKFSQDKSAEVLRGSFMINEDHFVSGILDFSSRGFDFKFELESILLPKKVSASISSMNMKNDYTLSASIIFRNKHYLELKFSSESDIQLSGMLSSNLLPYQNIELQCFYSNFSSTHNAGLDLTYDNHSVRLQGYAKMTSFYDFIVDGMWTITQLNLVNLKTNIEVNFDMTRSVSFVVAEDNRQFKFVAEFEDLKEDIVGEMLMITPFENFDIIEISTRIKGIYKDIFNSRLIMNVITSNGESSFLLSWNVTENNITVLKRLDLPKGTNFFISFRLDLKEKVLYLKSQLPMIGVTEAILHSSNNPVYSSFDQKVKITVKFNNQNYKAVIYIGYSQGYEMKIAVTTSHEGFSFQEIDVGFANSPTRKMLKALLFYEGGEIGVGGDFFFNSWANLNVFSAIFLPHEHWTDVSLEIRNQRLAELTDIRFGGRYGERRVMITYYFDLYEMMMDLLFNNNKMNFTADKIHFNANFTRTSVHSEIDTYFVKMLSDAHYEISDKGTSFHVNVNAADKYKMRFTKTVENNRIYIELNDIFYPVRIVSTVALDSTNVHNEGSSLGILLEVISNDGTDAKPFLIFEIINRFTNSGGDFRIKGKSMNVEISDLSIIYGFSASQSTFNMQFVKNLENLIVLNLSSIKHNSTDNQIYRNLIVLNSPYLELELVDKSDNGKMESFKESSIKYRKGKGEARGIGLFQKFSKELDGATNIEVVIRRPKHVFHGNESLLIRVFQLKNKNILEVKRSSDDPLNRFYMKVSGSLSETPEKIDTSLLLTYSFGPMPSRNLDVFGSYDKVATAGNIIIKQENVITEIKGKIKSGKTAQSASFMLYTNADKKLSLVYDLNRERKRVIVDMSVPGDIDINIFLGLDSKTKAALRVNHNYLGANVKDLLISFSLIGGQQLDTMLEWRKEIFKDLQSYVKWLVDKVDSSEMDDNAADLLVIRSLKTFAIEALDDVMMTKASMEFEQLREDSLMMVFKARDGLTGRPNTNEQLLAYIVESCAELINRSVDALKILFDLQIEVDKILHTFVWEFFVLLEDGATEVHSHLFKLKEKLVHSMNRLDFVIESLLLKASDILRKIKSTLQYYVKKYEEFLSAYSGGSNTIFQRFLVHLKGEISSFSKDFLKHIKNYQSVQEMQVVLNRIRTWLDETELYNTIENCIRWTKRKIVEGRSVFSFVKERAQVYFQIIKEYETKAYNLALSYPAIEYFVSLTKSWINLGKDVVSSVLQDYDVRRLLDTLLSRANIYTALAFKLGQLNLNKRDMLEYNLVFQPEKGYVNYIQSLPLQWYEFEEIPSILDFSSSGESTKEPVIDVTDFYIKFYDAVRSFLSMIHTKTFLPPFSATAMLVGNKHIITFDGKIYDFGGYCSYLLASDFGNNRFSIIANYNMEKRISITVKTDASDIELFNDGRVFLNQTRVELPLLFENTYVKQEGNRVILYNKQGLIINYNIVQNICSVKVSGWYYGRTGGLLGLYDNEPRNDWILPSRVIVDDLDTFVKGWQVGGACEEHYTQFTESTNTWDREKCYNMFINTDSVFRPCFGVVDPKPYYNVCLKEMSINPNNKAGICLAGSGYVENCRLNKVDLDYPQDCIQCEIPMQADLAGGHTRRYTDGIKRSADVIFIMEESSCLHDLRFNTIVTLIESSLVEEDIQDNVYALVGYGGEGKLSKPHMFTSSSKVFYNVNGLQSAFVRLNKSGDGGDVFEAMKFAARMTVRPTVSKIFVLVNCAPVHERGIFGEASVMLRNRDIRMHYIAPNSIRLRNKVKKDIYGFDKFSVYTSQDLNTNYGDTRLRSHLKTPKDYLSALAINSGGLVFSQTVFSRHSVEAKRASSVLGRQIARIGTPTPCQLCECMGDDEGGGRVLCQKCIKKTYDILTSNWNRFSVVS